MRAAVTSIVLTVATCTACSRKPDWTPYTAQDGRFTVSMPVKPTEQTTPQIGGSVTTVLADRHAAGMFQVAHYAMPAMGDMPPETIDSALKIDCLSPYPGGVFVPGDATSRPLGSHRGIVVSGRAPRSATLTDGGFEEDRCYYVGERLYHVMGIAPDTSTGRADVARFLDSFAPR